MKNLFSLLAMFLVISFSTVACDEDDEAQVIDSSLPSGNFSVQRTGVFTAQNGTPTAGRAELGTDGSNTTFLRFGTDFTTQLATGTVTVYLSTSQNFVADPGNGNPNLKLIGIVNKNGETFFRLDSAIESKFTHVILWCGSANIPFGFAPLQ
ncbi:MAG: DM13 domain-containing protein [Saprospiraceae bacterium]|nr:DM13 domain-containing protein [Saprospiraceae bacterium]